MPQRKRVLITGGAGFIGSHLADELLHHGYEVRVLDSLLEQVHGPGKQRPGYLNDDVELLVGDVRDQARVDEALDGVDFVYHFAARVGVGQSMYQIREYVDVNDVGTATLLEALMERPVERLVVASSMSIYGEGACRDTRGTIHHHAVRSAEQLKRGEWELQSSEGRTLEPIPTPETKIPTLASVYALSKYNQERLALITGKAYDIPTVALRFFNVYGSRQALSNPYTGVLAIFSSRYMNDKPPLIFEDGEQRRDFIHVHDVARACRLALESERAAGEVFNVGSGTAYTVREIAENVGRLMKKPHIEPQITGKYRVGDIRHCFADITKAKNILGFKPEVSMEQGMQELLEWLKDQSSEDKVDRATEELAAKGLTLESRNSSSSKSVMAHDTT